MLLLLVLVSLSLLSVEILGKPNILYVLLDDWGYSDGWTKANNDGDFDLPVLSNLWGAEGLKLTSYYVNPTCSPTRSSFLTGQYSFRQKIVDPQGTMGKVGLDLNVGIITEYLHSNGYYNVLTGKWHLGHANSSYHPTNRYFDEALYMSSAMHTNQYNHTFCLSGLLLGMNATTFENYFACTKTGLWCYYDLWNEDITHVEENEYMNTYDGEIWTQNIVDFLESYYSESESSELSESGSESESGDDGSDQPWFLYWADNAPHSPVVAPPLLNINGIAIDYTNCALLIDINRKKYCQMLTYVGDSINIVISKLKELDAYENTLIIVSSDNGGEPGIYTASGLNFPAYGQNYPLRGSKFSTFEGGIHVPAFITGGYLPKELKNKEYSGLFHVVDWLPTILDIVKYKDIITDDIDGINQWQNILNLDNNNGRDEIAIIQYYSTSTTFTHSMLRQNDMKLVFNGGASGDYKDRFHVIYNGVQVNDTRLYKPIMLFNITNDPYELYDLSLQYPLKVDAMMKRLEAIRNGETVVFEALATKGQVTYVNDNYDINKRYGILGAWRDDAYYLGVDNNAAISNINLVFAPFLASPTCNPLPN